jgi:hypothetical protein
VGFVVPAGFHEVWQHIFPACVSFVDH